MKIEKDKWVEIHYTLKNDEGQQLDSSVGNEPLGYVHGRGYLIAGLEKLLEGHEPGDKFSAHIEPKDGYGEYDERLVVELDRDKFEFDGEITVGMPFQVMTPSGLSIVHVTKVEGDKITVNGNHELAGKTLNFDIDVVNVHQPAAAAADVVAVVVVAAEAVAVETAATVEAVAEMVVAAATKA